MNEVNTELHFVLTGDWVTWLFPLRSNGSNAALYIQRMTSAVTSCLLSRARMAFSHSEQTAQHNATTTTTQTHTYCTHTDTHTQTVLTP